MNRPLRGPCNPLMPADNSCAPLVHSACASTCLVAASPSQRACRAEARLSSVVICCSISLSKLANQLIQATQIDLDLLTAHGIPVLDVGSRRIHGAAFAHTGPTSPDLQFATFAAWGWTDGGASCA